MPFEDFKRRVRSDSTPETIEKWKEQASKGRRWVYLKGEVAEGAEPQAFPTRAEVEAHFRRIHAADSVIELRDVNVAGSIDKAKLAHICHHAAQCRRKRSQAPLRHLAEARRRSRTPWA